MFKTPHCNVKHAFSCAEYDVI